MDKNEVRSIVLWSVVIVGVMLLGSYLGVEKYKRGCEPLGTTPYKIEWLECKL